MDTVSDMHLITYGKLDFFSLWEHIYDKKRGGHLRRELFSEHI